MEWCEHARHLLVPASTSLKDEKAERSASKHNLKDEKAEPMAPEDTAAEGEKGETDPCGYAMERLL
jgi:hypothetical protein